MKYKVAYILGILAFLANGIYRIINPAGMVAIILSMVFYVLIVAFFFAFMIVCKDQALRYASLVVAVGYLVLLFSSIIAQLSSDKIIISGTIALIAAVISFVGLVVMGIRFIILRPKDAIAAIIIISFLLAFILAILSMRIGNIIASFLFALLLLYYMIRGVTFDQ